MEYTLSCNNNYCKDAKRLEHGGEKKLTHKHTAIVAPHHTIRG